MAGDFKKVVYAGWNTKYGLVWGEWSELLKVWILISTLWYTEKYHMVSYFEDNDEMFIVSRKERVELVLYIIKGWKKY